MTSTEPPEGFEEDGLPSSWSPSARETYLQISEAHPTLPPAALVVLFESCSLLALADRMEAQVDVEGLMVEGSKSTIRHPLLPEIRANRTSALAAIRGLGLGQTGTGTAAGAALASRRWSRS